MAIYKERPERVDVPAFLVMQREKIFGRARAGRRGIVVTARQNPDNS